jgi:hypothetical protein
VDRLRLECPLHAPSLHSREGGDTALEPEIEHRPPAHNVLQQLVPGFSDLIAKFHEKPERLETFINLASLAFLSLKILLTWLQLHRWASEARHEDTGSIKYNAIEYIPRNPEVDRVMPPILKNHGKSMRGFNHVAAARLLCPFRDLKKFDANPQ